MIIEPKVRGFLCITAHPQGCYAQVASQINYVKNRKLVVDNQPKKVLVIGASTGYGLASRIVASFGFGAKTIGVFFEKESVGKRTASPGWYNSAAFETEAHKDGLYAKSFNGDAFSEAMKQKVIECIRQDWDGQVDLIIYSLAAPRRQDHQGNVYQSTLKPVGKPYADKTLNILSGEVSPVEILPANNDEVLHTEKVMGGEDWELWVDALINANVLAPNAMTVAYSYIGPKMTYPIYREGTIGRAKEHLEKTAYELNKRLAQHCQGQALVSVNKALVTQASAAIPVVPLYISLMYKVMKEKNVHEGCIEQISRLFFDRLYAGDMQLDEQGRIRLDDLEMRTDVQDKIAELWNIINTDNIKEISDIVGYQKEFYQLFGFEFDGVDYKSDVDPAINIPSIAVEETA